MLNSWGNLVAEHPGRRYVAPNALIELWLPGGWTDVLWAAAIRNRARAHPPAPANEESSPALPAMAPTSSLFYGYDFPRIQLY